MIWEAFRAEYLDSPIELASGLLNLVTGNSMSLQDASHKSGAGQIEMFVQRVGKRWN